MVENIDARVERGKRTRRDTETAAIVLRRENGPLASPLLSSAHAFWSLSLSQRKVGTGGGELRRRRIRDFMETFIMPKKRSLERRRTVWRWRRKCWLRVYAFGRRSNALLLVSRGGARLRRLAERNREKRERKLGWNGSFKLLL